MLRSRTTSPRIHSQPGSLVNSLLRLLICGSLVIGGSSLTASDTTGEIHGRLVLDLPGVRLGQLGPMVAYLEGGPREPTPEVPRKALRISQSTATFDPDFLVVVAGQTLEMPNDDKIAHNVFSISPGNSFDLGIYPRGESRSVTFSQPGEVRVYCSIHASMNATILVVPSPYHSRVRNGSFELAGVPPGAYQLKIWSNKLAEIVREIEVATGDPQEVTLWIGSDRAAEAELSRR